MGRYLEAVSFVLEIMVMVAVILSGRFGTGTGLDGDHISIVPPFIITKSHCDEIVATLQSSIKQVKGSLQLTCA